MSAGQGDYQKFITELIQKHMLVLGPNIALDKAREVPGFQVANDGNVLQLTGDPQMVLKAVAEQYIVLSGAVAKMALDNLLAKYPDIKV